MVSAVARRGADAPRALQGYTKFACYMWVSVSARYTLLVKPERPSMDR